MPETSSARGASTETHIFETVPEQAQSFVELVQHVQAVQHVARGYDGEIPRLWCIAGEYDMDAFDAIFECQQALYKEWPGLECDFFVLALEGQNLESLLPPGFDIIWTRR